MLLSTLKNFAYDPFEAVFCSDAAGLEVDDVRHTVRMNLEDLTHFLSSYFIELRLA